MTHAMVISGVHLDASGKPVRYKVENSWGDAAGNKGYYLMTDAWFEQCVFSLLFIFFRALDESICGVLWLYGVLMVFACDRFVYQVVIPKALAPKELVKVYESDERVVLPAWDPMVSIHHRF